MIIKTITLKTSEAFSFKLKGNEESKTVIILVHGFGVKSDSRGLFTLIEDSFKDKILVVRPDFAEMGDDQIKAIPLSSQADRLQKVVTYITSEFGKRKMVFIGHSQGCIVIAKAQPQNSQVFLLAPPINSPYENFTGSEGWRSRGSSLDLAGESKLIRSDGTVIMVSKEYWDDFKQLTIDKLYANLTISNKVTMILAAEDHVLGKQKIPDGINGFSIEEANHDFKDDARIILIEKLSKLI